MRLWATALGAAIISLPATSAPVTATENLGFLEVCLTAQSDIDAMRTRLADDGWTATTQASDALIDGLTWIGTAQYFATDSGGENVGTILALNEKTTAGYLRKRDIPQSKARFLMRGDEVLHVMWRKPTPAVTEIECHAALSADTMDPVRRDHEADGSAFTQLPVQTMMDGKVYISLLNAEKLASHSAPYAILRTYLSVHSQ